jgi:thiamine transport system substrate-binding protein
MGWSLSFLKIFVFAQWVVIPHAAQSADSLTILTYDSIASPKGLAGRLVPEFESQCQCKVKLISSGDAGTLASRLELDARRGSGSVDLVWGFDEVLWPRIRPHVQKVSFQKPVPIEREVMSLISKEWEEGFVPFDYGVFAWMVDSDSKIQPPQSLSQLLLSAYRKKLLLQDPRTSTPGLAFLRFTQKQISDPQEWLRFWSSLSQQWLTLAPGWDQSYSLFLKGEAPLVWSYITSEAYHRMNGDSQGRYRALIFPDAMPVQIEGAALLKKAKNPALGTSFLEYLLSESAQMKIPEGNWMLPVRQGSALPPAFQGLPKPRKWISLKSTGEDLKDLLKNWSHAVHSK